MIIIARKADYLEYQQHMQTLAQQKALSLVGFTVPTTFIILSAHLYSSPYYTESKPNVVNMGTTLTKTENGLLDPHTRLNVKADARTQ